MTGSGTATLAAAVSTRAGMTDLIQKVRDMSVAGTGDYTLGTVSYWTDDQLQTILDRNRLTVVREELVDIAKYSTSGVLEYKEFYSQYGNYEQTTGGTAVFVIDDGTGNAIGTSEWTMDYANGVVTFASDQAGSVRYLNGYSYDIYTAAADVWRMKSGHHAGAVNFKTDNMSVNRGDLIKNDLQMANYYAGRGRVKKIQFDRDDTT